MGRERRGHGKGRDGKGHRQRDSLFTDFRHTQTRRAVIETPYPEEFDCQTEITYNWHECPPKKNYSF